MAENTTLAGSSSAEVDVFGGKEPTFDEFSRYRESGELPSRFKTEATTDAPEETADEPADDESETEPDSDPDDAQELPAKGSPAQKRILQLLAENKRLKQGVTAKPDAIPAPSTAQVAQPLPQTRPKPTIETQVDGKPKYATYEDYLEDLTDWKAEQHIERYKFQQAEERKLNTLKEKLEESRSRYEDADAVIFPAARAIQDAQIPLAVKEIFAQSDVFTDLCYVVGPEMDKFIHLAQTNPRAALAKVFEYEKGINEALAKASDGKSADKAPEKRSTSAPKPPSPVTGASSRAFDVSDESLSADEWARKRQAQIDKRKKG